MRYVVSSPPSQLVSKLPIQNREALPNFKGLSQDGDGSVFIKISAPYSLMTTYQMNLIYARSISLDRLKVLSIEIDLTQRVISR
jgi:hypothetical protein